MSVVPPPMSMIIRPSGTVMSSPDPRAAAMGSSIRYTCRAPAATTASTTASLSMPVMAAGTHTATRGLTIWELYTWLTKRQISSRVMVWSLMTPSFRGKVAEM